MAWQASPLIDFGAWRREVPLARRNVLSNPRRLLRSASGIAFAVLLMLLQLGFRGAFLDSALEIIRSIDGDIVLTSATKFRFGYKDPFSRRQLYAARGVDGVEWARPIYGEWMTSLWRNPQTNKTYDLQVLAFDPDQPVFLFPELEGRLRELHQPDTAFADIRARRFVGLAHEGTESELARRKIHIIGNFSLGPDFTTDGTLLTSDRTFMTFFAPRPPAEVRPPDVEFGVVKTKPGYRVADVQRELRRALPLSVAVRTKSEQIDLEIAFQNGVSPVGPIFLLGTFIGFIVGMMISYQILYTDLSDQLSQYATLKAMGYDGPYLIRVVLQQASFYGLVGYVPALLVAIGLFHVIGEIALLPMRMTPAIALEALVLTLAMCALSGAVAVRRVLATDPAEAF